MKKFLLLTIICAGIFTACKKDQSTPAVDDVRGNWVSVSYMGGLAGGSHVFTDNYLEVKDSTLKMWTKNKARTDDSLIINTTYKVTAHKDPNDSTIAHLFITLGTGIEQSVNFSDSKLVLNQDAMIADGIAVVYARTNKAAPSN